MLISHSLRRWPAWEEAVGSRAYPDAIVELDSADLERLEEGGNGLPIRLRVESSTSRRVLSRHEVKNVWCRRVDQGSHFRRKVRARIQS